MRHSRTNIAILFAIIVLSFLHVSDSFGGTTGAEYTTSLEANLLHQSIDRYLGISRGELAAFEGRLS